MPLFLPQWTHLPLQLIPLVRAMALQLLALGYGRRELHTGRFPGRDANLIATRRNVHEWMMRMMRM